MIADKLERLALYYGMHPNLDVAIRAALSMDFDRLPDGRHEVAGQDVFCNLMHTKLAMHDSWEAHRDYMDLQLVLAHEETMGWAPLESLQGFSPYNAQKDIQQYKGPFEGSRLHLKAGEFALFMPGDAHQPGLGQGEGRKAVFKIRVQAAQQQATPMLLNHKGTQELHTKRLLLRRYRPEDAQAMFDSWCTDPRVVEHLYWHCHESLDFTRKLLADWIATYANPMFYHWAIEREGTVIGDIACVGVSDRQMQCEIGYCLSHDYWGQGIMTEALVGVMQYLFREVGFHRIMARHVVSNPASGRVMEKAGMQKEGLHRQYRNPKHGSFEDLAQYAAIREEWLAAYR